MLQIKISLATTKTGGNRINKYFFKNPKASIKNIYVCILDNYLITAYKK